VDKALGDRIPEFNKKRSQSGGVGLSSMSSLGSASIEASSKWP